MKQEIEDFYNGYKLPVRSMIRAGGKRGLTPEAVMEAAEVVYNEIQGGLQIKPIRIAWRVYEKAGPLIAKKKQEKADAIDEIRKTVQELKAQIDWHTLPWYIKLWRWLNVDHQ